MNKLATKKEKQSTFWVKMGIAALLVRLLFGFFPSLCESLYARGLFPFIRTFFDHTFGLLPFAGVYIFLIVLVVWLPKQLFFMLRDVLIRKQNYKKHAWGFFNFVGGLFFWFLILWGYNYARIPMAQQIEIQPPEAMDFEAIWEEAQFIKKKCITVRQQIPQADTNAITANFFEEDLVPKMRKLVEEVLLEYGYDVSGHVPGRLLPAGSLLRFSSSGVYFPFTGEGHIDDGMPAVVKPFTIAHELGHGYGFGSEAACNFIGYLACVRSDKPAIQYAGYLMYWRYVYGELMQFMTEADYLLERSTISRGMYNDLELIYATLDRYPPLIPYVQQTAYDMYLKAQGIEDGIESYNRVVLWVTAWRKKYQ